ncbi:MAG: helix-turn-helix transcriptional regulator [Candidatus Omnitrophota bacterium]|nr:helix-turn-helix transcriptional regulator [Candidatus Omnitrophota bacterium]
MNIAKYFWNLNDRALKEAKHILKSPQHPKFSERMVTLLSRCDQPKEVFSLISKEEFIKAWPGIKSYWVKLSRESDFRDWWETIYEQLLEGSNIKNKSLKGEPPASFIKIGALIKEARIKMGLSQKELAFNTGMKQPDISKIEEGKKNVTLETLLRLCKILKIRKIDTDI